MKYKLNKIIVLIFAVFLFTFFNTSFAKAAEMFFVVPKDKTAQIGFLEVNLLLNTEEESINAVAGKVIFPTNILEFKEARDGNSVVNLWLDKPEFKTQEYAKNSGQVVFSGITPGGYKGRNGQLFSLLFKIIKPAQIKIKLVDGQALLNDGKGTAAKLSYQDFNFQVVTSSQSSSLKYNETDKTSPEPIFSQVSQQNNLENNKWFVAFDSKDKDSGIDHYEIQESLSGKPNDNNWKIVSNPYVLQDQSLKSYIFIKAVDKVGNSTITTIPPKIKSYSQKKIIIFVLISGLVVLLVWWLLRENKNRA